MKGIIKNVIEAFSSYQGEGVDAGKRMFILRLWKCQRNCKFCDTQVKMRISQPFEINMEDLQQTIYKDKCGLMLTGGEPTFGLQYATSLMILKELDCNLFNVETNGLQLEKLSKEVDNKNIKFMLSPKLFSEEDLYFYRYLSDKLKDDDRMYIKLVYEGTELNDTFLDYITSINFPNHRIYLMPEGTTRKKLIENSPKVFDACEKYKCNFSSRNHIIYNFI